MFHWLEKNPFFFAVGVFVVIAYAGIVEIIPSFMQAARPLKGTKPYTVLQIAGRQVYINNGCSVCHSQLIRPFKSETDRYGKYSLSGEYAFDRPFLWGSRRIGPDLHRVGNYRTTDWNENHMLDPQAVVPGSVMPKYGFMFKKSTDLKTAYAEAYTVKKVFNVPYDKPGMPKLGSYAQARKAAFVDAGKIVAHMRNKGVKDAYKKGDIKEIVAIIAYLNSLK